MEKFKKFVSDNTEEIVISACIIGAFAAGAICARTVTKYELDIVDIKLLAQDPGDNMFLQLIRRDGFSKTIPWNEN